MRKESKLSRVPAPDETKIRPSLPFLGMKFDVTAPASIQDEITMQWARFVPAFKMVNKKSLAYKTIPKFRKGIKDIYTKNQFMLTASDEKWVFNWSKAQKILEINVANKMPKAKMMRLAAFSFGVMMYDTGLRPVVKKFFTRKIKQDQIPLQGVQRYLKFFKDGAQLGRARASFAFGFMMHLEQVPERFFDHPLHALVGEVLFDNKAYIVKEDQGYAKQFKIDDLAPLAYQYDPKRFETAYAGKSAREIANLKSTTVGGLDFEDALDQTGIGPFQNALKQNIIKVVNDPSHSRHATVMRGLGISSASQLDESKFELGLSAGSTSLYSTLRYNGRTVATANRTNLSKTSQYNALVEVTPNFQKLGSGMHMTASQIETAMRTGKKKITVSAALSGGWKTWNKFGFESNNPVLSIYSSDTCKQYCEKSVDKKLLEMGDNDRQEVLVKLLKEMVRTYSLQFSSVETSPVVMPVNPPLPSNRNEDVSKILKAVIRASGSYSTAMKQMLRRAGIVSESNVSSIDSWMSSNTVTQAQQQKVHDYFLGGSSSFETKFRQGWGYPPRVTNRSTPRVSNTQVDSAVKSLIETWGWFGNQPFSAQMVLQLLDSAEMDVVHGYKNLEEMMAYLRTAGLEERSNVLVTERLTPRSQYMQDLMEVPNFTSFWDNLSSKPSWGGTMSFDDGKYSLAVLAMDRYRKLKISLKPQLANDPAFQRARRASLLEEFSIDPDLLAKFPNTEDVELDGGIARVDIILMEQALRDAQLIRQEIKMQMKEQEGEAITRVASRWLGGE